MSHFNDEDLDGKRRTERTSAGRHDGRSPDGDARREFLLLRLNEAAHTLSGSARIQERVTGLLREYFESDRCFFCEIEDDDAIVRRDARVAGRPSVAGVYPLGMMPMFRAAIDAGSTIVVQDVHESGIVNDHLLQICERLGVVSFIIVPVMRSGRACGLLCVTHDAVRTWKGSEVDLATDVADRIWAVIEQVRTEEALRVSERRYHTLFESIDQGFCVVEIMFDDDDRPIDFRFLETNPAFARLTGVDDVTGRRARTLIPDSRLYEVYSEVALTGIQIRFALQSSRTGRWFEVHAFRFGEPEDRCVAVLFDDVTEKKNADDAMREMNESLEKRVIERTRQVRTLASRLTMSEQEERRRISRILHDDLQQLLYGVDMQMSMLREELEQSDRADLVESLDGARELISRSISTTRRLSVDLSPPILEGQGLTDALEWLRQQMLDMHGLRIRIEAEHSFRFDNEDLRVLLFQIVRELLFNVKKHAGTDYAVVRLEQAPGDGERDYVLIHVMDQGRGFDTDRLTEREAADEGFGLFSVRERLALIGGSLEVESDPGAGTRVTVRAPS